VADVAGRDQGLRALFVTSGRLRAGHPGPVHCHAGDEVLRIVSGRLLVRCGDDRRVCGPGDLVTVAAGQWHGFRVLQDCILEVVAEYDIGTTYPVLREDGTRDTVEVYRRDMPWGRQPPPGQDWTSDDRMQAVLDHLAEEV